MSSISITRRPVPVAATAAAVAILAFAGVTIAEGHHGSTADIVPGQQTVHHGTFHPTTSGGRVQLSLP